MSHINLDEVEFFSFPDGQPHIKLDIEKLDSQQVVDVLCRIRTPQELFKLVMVSDLLKHKGLKSRLHIKYLMGARMDRRIDDSQPFTLKLVCDIINNSFPDSPVSVFCPHSEAVSLLLKNYVEFLESETNFYYRVFEQIEEPFTLILPDAGAGKRWHNSFHKFNDSLIRKNCNIVECSKKRDMQTGKLSSFVVTERVNKTCLILDDLCDGGRTFIGLAKELRENGAKRVELAVCHGIFSYGYDLEGVDQIYTTNSFTEHKADNVWSYKV
jgi:ribose-phosphate pyrophosphokinase